MRNLIGKKVLVSCSDWFIAPDGKEYKAAWGTLNGIVSDEDMKLKMARMHANFYLLVGKFMIAGCEAKFVIESEQRPNTEESLGWTHHEGNLKTFSRPSLIYFAE